MNFWAQKYKRVEFLGQLSDSYVNFFFVFVRCIIKMDLVRLVGGGEWIHLAQEGDRWRAVVNAVMNLRVLAPRS
jgi:hypothetical protein